MVEPERPIWRFTGNYFTDSAGGITITREHPGVTFAGNYFTDSGDDE